MGEGMSLKFSILNEIEHKLFSFVTEQSDTPMQQVADGYWPSDDDADFMRMGFEERVMHRCLVQQNHIWSVDELYITRAKLNSYYR